MRQGEIRFPDERAPELPLPEPRGEVSFGRVAELGRDAARTARSAAERFGAELSDDQREWSDGRVAVFTTIRAHGAGGATCHELEAQLCRTHQGVSPRITELRKLGAIVASGMYRRTPSGRKAIVWIVKGEA